MTLYYMRILSQSSCATSKGPEFYTTYCCRAVYVGKIAQPISKDLYHTDKLLSGSWFCELLYDWSKCLWGLRTLWVVMNFIKLSVEFQLIEIWAFIPRPSIQLNAKSILRKLPETWNSLKYVLKRVSFGSKDSTKELKPEFAYILGQTS